MHAEAEGGEEDGDEEDLGQRLEGEDVVREEEAEEGEEGHEGGDDEGGASTDAKAAKGLLGGDPEAFHEGAVDHPDEVVDDFGGRR